MAYTTIDNPELYFQTKLYTGNGSTNAITLDGSENMQPDWVWCKVRSQSDNHAIFDSVRGGQKQLRSNSNSAELTRTNAISSFNSDGFTMGGQPEMNTNGQTYVAWNWKAGGSASSNSNGSITSSVSASTTAGFSIVSYTGTGSNATVGHGLGVAPTMMIIKNRDDTDSWYVWQQNLGAVASNYINLNTTGAKSSVSDGITALSSSTFSLGNRGDVNASSEKYIAYCFADVQGYSKFGSYVGNGSNNGTFVYTAFKTSFVLLKNTGISENWSMHDLKRNENVSPNYARLVPDDSQVEATNTTFAKLQTFSNGFKLGNSADVINDSGVEFIYMAFAENPFTSSAGTPVTAR